MRLQSGAGEERTGKEASRGRGSSWTGVGSLLGRWEPRRACGHPTLCLWLGQQQGGDTPQTPPQPTRLCLADGQAQSGQQAPSGPGTCAGPGCAHLHRTLVPEAALLWGRLSTRRSPLSSLLSGRAVVDSGCQLLTLPTSASPGSSQEPRAGTSTPREGLTALPPLPHWTGL